MLFRFCSNLLQLSYGVNIERVGVCLYTCSSHNNSHRVEAICVLNQERVFEDIYNIRRDGALHALCMDPLELKMYTYQKHKVWTYTPFNETRLTC